jgi:CheY-like chemotaxis protein
MQTRLTSCVLVVDDAAVEVLCEALEAEGCEVLSAESGEKALKHDARQGKVDIVFTDIGMPEMSGWELASEIRSSETILASSAAEPTRLVAMPATQSKRTGSCRSRLTSQR